MKTKSLAIAIVLFLFVAGLVQAQPQPLEDALLWEISGSGLESNSYIYGTMHMLCEEDFFISDQLASALEMAESVTFELDMGAPDFMAQLQGAMISPVPLSQKLTPEAFNTLDSIVQLKAATPLKALDNLNLMAISSFLMSKSLPCETPKSYEFELLTMAQAKNKAIGGLESVPMQMEYFGKAFSDSFLLEQLLHFDERSYPMEEMASSYKNQQLDQLFMYVTDEAYADIETEKWLLEERNENWIKLMPAIMEKGSTLFAVGAAHLAGDHGIIGLLRSKGYTVTPIKN